MASAIPTRRSIVIHPQTSGLERCKGMAFCWLITVARYARMASVVICELFWRTMSSAKVHGGTIGPILLEELRLCLAFTFKMTTRYLVMFLVKFGAILYIWLRPECEKEFWDAMPLRQTLPEETPPVTEADVNGSNAGAHDHVSLASTFDTENDRMETHAVQVVNCEPGTTIILTKKKVGRERIRAYREERKKKGLKVVTKGDEKD